MRTLASGGEVASKNTTHDEQRKALKLVQRGAFREVVQTFRKREGFAPHPYAAFKIAAGQSEKLRKRTCRKPSLGLDVVAKKRTRKSPRASTPRNKRH